jgi:hypothetical protein
MSPISCRYDVGTGKTGIDVHADDAAVNLNLWIADAEQRGGEGEDAEEGGMVVYRTLAPESWDFHHIKYPQQHDDFPAWLASATNETVSVFCVGYLDPFLLRLPTDPTAWWCLILLCFIGLPATSTFQKGFVVTALT